MEYKHHRDRLGCQILSMPIIYGMIIPFIILHIGTEIYQHVCFPLYGIPLVDRKKYIKFDRFRLPYLTFIQKFNCTYCAYANGLMKYVTTIVAETEKYWCGIRHRPSPGFQEPEHEKHFLAYGDKKAYEEFVKKG